MIRGTGVSGVGRSAGPPFGYRSGQGFLEKREKGRTPRLFRPLLRARALLTRQKWPTRLSPESQSFHMFLSPSFRPQVSPGF